MLARLELCYAYVGVIFYEQGIIQAWRTARGAEPLRPGASDIGSSVTQLMILLVLLMILAARWRSYTPLLRPMLPYLSIVLLCVASTAWSDNPLQTARRSLSLVSCMLFGLYLERSFGLGGAIKLVGSAAVFLGLLSVVVFVAAPSVGRETASGYEQAMRGVFSQKNPMAECMLLGVTCYGFRIVDEGPRLPHLACIAIMLLCITLGRSVTSMGIALLVLVSVAFMAMRGRQRLQLALGISVAWSIVAAFVLAAVAPSLIFALLGRDASVTGRTPLWHEVLRVIAERPLFGHGYAGFWNDQSREVQYLWLLTGWQPPDSHNGYLDVWIQIGVAGLALYLFLWWRVTRRAIAAARAGTLRESRWVLLFMLVNITLNLDEGPLPFPNEFTMLMPGAVVTLAAWHQRHRLALPRMRWKAIRPAFRVAPQP
jgi:O-antigen ligase